ncbi:hypothetical protein EJ03DRAFT_326675 [Teratosphaeria nubilosa]|uniref:SMODS and SLOG-associating 2TM effector domain-containing protein n=1 Tax=Teratosphaeria nubilosa TaxID=161662 RepID=A0A6G1LBG4_9PEZI|nr:hypothetical protein EJ03DRAFT_326675 [Teratosphaeria nubilosa]
MRGDHHVPIAVLGAVSVGIAGCLALIKGQGLPMRIRMERDALWEVQLEAEELHWKLAAGGAVKFSDVKRIWSRYVQVERDSSLSHPDTWTTSANQAAQAVDVTHIASGTAVPAAGVPAQPESQQVTAPPLTPGSVYTPGGGLRQVAMADDGMYTNVMVRAIGRATCT